MLNHTRRLLPAVALGLLLCSTVAAQSPVIRQQPLPMSMANWPMQAVVQTRDGGLWVGTPGGLVYYDGGEAKLYTTRDSLAENNITALYEDTSRTLWIGHKSGAISRFMGNRIHTFAPEEGTPTKEIKDFVMDKLGNLWIATYGEGIYYYTPNHKVFIVDSARGLTDLNVYTLALSPGGIVYAGTDGGMYTLLPQDDNKFQCTNLSMKDGLPDNIVKDLRFDREGRLWVAMQDSGITRFSITTKRFERFVGWHYGGVNSIAQDGSGKIWLATDGAGVVRYNPTARVFRQFTHRNGLSNDKALAIIEDLEGTIWVGCNVGLNQLMGDRFEFMRRSDGLTSSHIHSLLIDRQDNLWVGSDSGLTRFSKTPNGGFTTRQILQARRGMDQEAMKAMYISSLYQDKQGIIWIGTYGRGFYLYYPGTDKLVFYDAKPGANRGIQEAEGSVFGITEDQQGYIWLATIGGGALRIAPPGGDKLQIQRYNSTNGLAGDYVYQVFVDKTGNTWFAHDGTGITRYDGKQFTTYGDSLGLKESTVFCIQQDSKGNIWAMTANHGFYRFTGTGFEAVPYEFSSTEASPTVFSLTANDRVVMGTVGSMVQLIPGQSGILRSYDTDDGLDHFEPNLNAIFRDAGGSIWIGTQHGVVRFNPTSQSPREGAPGVSIKRLRIFQDEAALTRDTSFAHYRNNLTFDFVGINLTTPRKVFYQYKLEGLNTDWSLPSQQRFITFPNLSPGDYTLLVRASVNRTEWSAQPARYTFSVSPPWYWNIYAWVFYLLALGAGAYTYVRQRERILLQEKVVLEQKVQERTAEVVAQKDEIEKKNVMLVNANEEILATNDRLQDAYKEISVKNEDITESINYARRLQQSILPSIGKIRNGLHEAAIFYMAKDIVSGDFYWYQEVNDQSFIAAVDCTGHGVPGAIMSIMGYNLLNQIINQHHDYKPDKILLALDEKIIEALQQRSGHTESKDGMDLALVQYDKPNNRIHFAGAMRPLYYVRGGELLEIKGDPYPMGGGQHDQKQYVLHSIDLQPGDIFYIFSDGLVDQFGGERGRKFTPKRVREIIQQTMTQPVEQQVAQVQQAFESWKGQTEQLDDVMFIAFKPMA